MSDIPRTSIRRDFLAAALTATAAHLLPRGANAQPPAGEREAADLVKPAIQTAIDKGLAWLAKRQTEEGCFGGAGFARNVAVCSLAGLAFLSSGSTPSRGPLGAALDKVVRYVLDSGDDSGLLCRRNYTSHGPMYDHGFATLLLAEVHGMSAAGDLPERLRKAVRLIVSSQNPEGGWRYEPDGREADISVTICQIMALRAAKNAGIYVPSETVANCIDYVKRCQNADGGFMYMLTGGPSRFPRSAAGVAALYSAGIYEGDEISKGLEYLTQNPPQKNEFGRDTHVMYGHYYAVQAMWQAGGDRWRKWYPAVSELLLAEQKADGSWSDIIAAEYGTAMACIVLQMPNNFLPIFQR